jgi:hypothetical protein
MAHSHKKLFQIVVRIRIFDGGGHGNSLSFNEHCMFRVQSDNLVDRRKEYKVNARQPSLVNFQYSHTRQGTYKLTTINTDQNPNSHLYEDHVI